MRSDWRTLILAGGAVLCVVWLFGVMAHRAGRGGETAPLYSAYRYDPYGTAAIHQWMRTRGTPVRIVEHSRLRADDTGVLIQVMPGPKFSGFSANSHEPTPTMPTMAAEPLKAWIEQGNIVVQFTSATTSLMKAFDVGVPFGLYRTWDTSNVEGKMSRGFPPDTLNAGPEIIARWDAQAAAAVGVPTPGVSQIAILAQMPLVASPGVAWTPLATAPDGNVYAGAVTVGKGRLIVISCPTPALNGYIVRSQNAALIEALVGPGPVLLDAWSQGLGHGGGVMDTIQRTGLMPVLLQTLLALSLYIWAGWGIRRPETVGPPRRRSIGEQVLTLGYLYSQSLSTTQVMGRTRQVMERTLAAALRTPVSGLTRKLARLGNDPWATAARNLLARMPQVASRPTPRCRNCNYALRGVTSQTCPECATVIPPATRRIIETMTDQPLNEADTEQGRVEKQAVALLQSAHQLSQETQRERTRRE